MKDKKNIAIGLLIALIALGGSAWAFAPEQELPTPVLPVDGKDGERGWAGAKGNTGLMGLPGVQGKEGDKGVDGKDAVVDMDKLVDLVLEELENEEEEISFSYDEPAGNYSLIFEVPDDEDYKFVIRHFGSGDFDVSLENEDGDVSSMVNTEGHFSVTDVRYLEEGQYKIKVSADGAWEMDIEVK